MGKRRISILWHELIDEAWDETEETYDMDLVWRRLCELMGWEDDVPNSGGHPPDEIRFEMSDLECYDQMYRFKYANILETRNVQ